MSYKVCKFTGKCQFTYADLEVVLMKELQTSVCLKKGDVIAPYNVICITQFTLDNVHVRPIQIFVEQTTYLQK